MVAKEPTHRQGKKYQTWRLPSAEEQQRQWQAYTEAQRFYQSVEDDGTAVQLGHKQIAQHQYLLDEQRGGLVAMVCGR